MHNVSKSAQCMGQNILVVRVFDFWGSNPNIYPAHGYPGARCVV